MAKTASASSQTALKNVRKICLELPETTETMTWGNPHFRVKDKIFCGFNDEKGESKIGFKLEMGHAQAIIQDPRFCPAPYVGHKGWVSMTLEKTQDWQEVRKLVRESYYLIAPKKLAKQMLETDLAEEGQTTGKTITRKPAAKGADKSATAKTSKKTAKQTATTSLSKAAKPTSKTIASKSRSKTSKPAGKATATKLIKKSDSLR